MNDDIVFALATVHFAHLLRRLAAGNSASKLRLNAPIVREPERLEKIRISQTES